MSRRIIELFERDMNALSDILTWAYCNSGGEALSNKQVNDFNYNSFIKSYVVFEVFGEKEQEEL